LKNTGFANRLFDVLNFALLALFTLCILLPFYYMFVLSVSDPVAVGMYQTTVIPKGLNFVSYTTVFQDNQIVQAYWNSILYTVTGTLLALVFGCLTAYPLSVARFRARKILTIMFTATMFFSGGLIPTFMVIRNLGMLDTIWAVTLPGAFTFWNIIILRTNFQMMPSAIIESAHIDGANDWRILYQIVIPLSKAILATIGLFASVGLWNAYFAPLIYLTSPEKQTLTLILRRILISNEVFSQDAMDTSTVLDNPMSLLGKMVSLRMATIFVTIGPIVLIYPFVQKYFVRGVLIGSVKG